MQPREHSKPGIISFVVALVVGFLVTAVLVGSFFTESGTYAAQRYDKFLFIFTLIVAPIFYLSGLTIGIVGAFDKNSKRIFAVFGIILNGIALAIAAVFWILIVALGIAILSSAGGVWM